MIITTGVDGIRRYTGGTDAGRWANMPQVYAEAYFVNSCWNNCHWCKRGDYHGEARTAQR